MAQTLTIDLKKNPAVADIVNEMQPGDRLKVMTTIAHKDEQTLKLTLEEVVECGAPDDEEGDESESPDEANGETPADEADEDSGL